MMAPDDGAASRQKLDANTATEAQHPQPGEESASRDPFGIDADMLIDDIRGSVTEYCADGFDALERCLLSDLPVASEEQRQELAQGAEVLYQRFSARLEQQMDLFEGHALQSCLQIPPGLDLQQSPPSSEGDAPPAESEAQLKGELAGLRAAIQAARSDVRQMRAQLAAMDRDLALHGDKAELEAVAAPAAGKENVAEDARAIAADAARLRPLLAKAQRLQAAQAARSQPQAAGSVAAADQELRRRRRMLGGGGGADGAINRDALRQAAQLMAAHEQGAAATAVDAEAS